MSPLSEAIYQILALRAGLASPLISYHQLVKKLPALPPPYDNIARTDGRLFEALGEVGNACRERGLPTLTALVIRSAEQTPGAGYFHMFHPEAGDDPQKQKDAWESELARVRSATYPPLHPAATAQPEDRGRPRPLGHLRIADEQARAATVFTGQFTCPHCSALIGVAVERNPNALSPKQPAFVMVETGSTPSGRSVGHLFLGTILSSPVLYYGSIAHCAPEQRVVVFFNRALRDRSDPHLTIMPTAAAPSGTPAAEDGGFKLS